MGKIVYKRISAFVEASGLLMVLLVALGVLLAGCTSMSARSNSQLTAVNQDLTVEKGDLVKGNAVATGGNISVLGEVRGDVVVTEGNANMCGTADGDVPIRGGWRARGT